MSLRYFLPSKQDKWQYLLNTVFFRHTSADMNPLHIRRFARLHLFCEIPACPPGTAKTVVRIARPGPTPSLVCTQAHQKARHLCALQALPPLPDWHARSLSYLSFGNFPTGSRLNRTTRPFTSASRPSVCSDSDLASSTYSFWPCTMHRLLR